MFPKVGHSRTRGMFRKLDTERVRLQPAKFINPGLPPPPAPFAATMTAQGHRNALPRFAWESLPLYADTRAAELEQMARAQQQACTKLEDIARTALT